MKIEVSNGEIVDKVTILMIKKDRITDSLKIENISTELDAILPDMLSFIQTNHPLFVELKSVNEQLWEIEDLIRDKERHKQFDEEFVQLARKVYIKNDERAIIKRSINQNTGSSIFEEKSYAAY